MRLDGLFKKRGCAVLAAVALFLCLAVANAGAQDIDSVLWSIQEAIRGDDGATVVRLIRQNGIDINAPYYIHLVGRTGSAPDRAVDVGYATALSAAAYEGSANVVRALLDAGADPNANNRSGGRALEAPAYSRFRPNGQIAAVRMLIAGGADVNAQDKNGDTALMDYAKLGKQDLAKVLLDAGADVNKRNNEGETALMIAEREGNAEMAKLLREARGYR